VARRFNERRQVKPAKLAAAVAEVRAVLAAVMGRLGREWEGEAE